MMEVDSHSPKKGKASAHHTNRTREGQVLCVVVLFIIYKMIAIVNARGIHFLIRLLHSYIVSL